jgi:hypothetical protein
MSNPVEQIDAGVFGGVTAGQLLGCGEHVCGEVGLNDLAGHLGQRSVVVAGVAARLVEGRVHAQAPALGEDPLGLLDDHPIVQRGLQLGDHLTAADGAFGQDPDRRDVGECLTHRQVSLG